MVDVVRMTQVRIYRIEKTSQTLSRLQRIDNTRNTAHFFSKRIALSKFNLINKVLSPGTWQIPGMTHRERYYSPPLLLENSIVLEKDGLGASTVVVIIIHRQ